jgi:hypothetical protein
VKKSKWWWKVASQFGVAVSEISIQ